MAVVVHEYVVGHDRVYEYTGLVIVSLYTDQLNVVDEDDREAPDEGLVIVRYVLFFRFTENSLVSEAIFILSSLAYMSTVNVYSFQCSSSSRVIDVLVLVCHPVIVAQSCVSKYMYHDSW